MSTLAVVEEVLRETSVPMSVREIMERAGSRLPSKSKRPDMVVARDLSMDIKKKGETSLFVRSSRGRFTLRSLKPPRRRSRLTVGRLLVRWSTRHRDFLISYPSAADGHLFYGLVSQHEKLSSGRTLLEELDARGYNTRTLRIQVDLKDPA